MSIDISAMPTKMGLICSIKDAHKIKCTYIANNNNNKNYNVKTKIGLNLPQATKLSSPQKLPTHQMTYAYIFMSYP